MSNISSNQNNEENLTYIVERIEKSIMRIITFCIVIYFSVAYVFLNGINMVYSNSEFNLEVSKKSIQEDQYVMYVVKNIIQNNNIKSIDDINNYLDNNKAEFNSLISIFKFNIQSGNQLTEHIIKIPVFKSYNSQITLSNLLYTLERNVSTLEQRIKTQQDEKDRYEKAHNIPIYSGTEYVVPVSIYFFILLMIIILLHLDLLNLIIIRNRLINGLGLNVQNQDNLLIIKDFWIASKYYTKSSNFFICMKTAIFYGVFLVVPIIWLIASYIIYYSKIFI